MTSPLEGDESFATDQTPDATELIPNPSVETNHERDAGRSPKLSGEASLLPEQFGRYRIERELGRGGMGAVFLAHDRQLDRKVALKVPFFKDQVDLEAIERFYREARTMATLQHANLCPVFDVGQFEHWHYLTMAYIEGVPLSNKLKVEGAFEVGSALMLMRKVAMAVHKAHDAGIVHRDLKPGNIMLTRDQEPIILDFGLARRRKEGEVELTHSGAVFGTPAYMAPEQVEARHHEIGPATDVYALGNILYHLVAGRRPFEGTAASIFGQIVSRAPDAPSVWATHLPAELDSICLKALSKCPADRHPSAADLAGELANLQSRLGDGTITISYQPVSLMETTGTDVVTQKRDDAPKVNRSPRPAELRQVTVAIFNYETDDSSLTSTSASHSEVLHEQAQLFSRFVGERVARFGGVTVAGTGQEVIACFAFPQAYEDAAERAVRAAMQVRRDLATTVSPSEHLPKAEHAWTTIHIGEAVAELLGPEAEAPISLMGDARNMAAQLDVITQPGTITISPTTFQRVSLYFECESLGTQRVRGQSQPVELFQVIKEAGSRNRVDLVDPANLTPLVGRDTELTILKDRWEQALEELGQVVLLIGDAGLGKSRLIRELREHVGQPCQAGLQAGKPDLSSESPTVIELRCSQYHQNTSFFPMVDFLSRLLRLEHQTPEERLETVVRYLREMNLESAEHVALFCGVLGIPTDSRFPPLAISPQKLKERTVAFLLHWLKALVAINPVLFLVEDLHWVDPSTLELLEKHVTQFESGRILSILTFRPEFETPWKSKSHQTQIALSRLTKRQIGEMMCKRTHRQEIPEPLLKQVIDRTDGIPLFIEEFTNVIVESAILDREHVDDSTLLKVIPATLHDLLLSRLDRMDADREIIQLAATIGREFSFEVLAASCTLPEAELQCELDKLVKAEILFQKGHGSSAHFIFKHALLQDAAYRLMLSKTRQACHQRIAMALETQFGEIGHSQPELLAHHFTEADVTDKAVEYWLKAGQKSQEQSANLEALQQFERGLTLLMTLPPSPQRDVLELSFKLPLGAVLMGVHGYAAPAVEPLHNRCIEICRQLGEGAPLFPVLVSNWVWLFVRSRFAECFERCPEVIAMAEEAGDAGMIAEAQWTQVCTSMYAGDFLATRSHAETGWQNYRREVSIEFAKFTQQNSGPLNLSQLGLALWQLGYADQGIARVLEALDLSIDLKHLFTQTVIEWMAGQVYEFSRHGDKAIEYGKRCCRIAEEQAFAFWIGMGTSCQGVGLKLLGRFDEAIETLQAGISQMESTGALICRPKYKGHLADSLWQAGQRDAAVRKLDEAFANQVTGEYFTHAELLRFRGDFAFDRGDLDQAAAFYRQSLAVAAQQGSKMYELRTTLHLSRIWKHEGLIADIRRHLVPLCDSFTEGFDMPDMKAAKEFLAQLG